MSKTREEAFQQIRAYYLSRDTASIEQGTLPMRSTEVGFWGTSNTDDVYDWFTKKRFSEDTRFLDVGCGDGRVVAIASLFVQASGIEYDEALATDAREALNTLGLSGSIVVGDAATIDFSNYDVLYFYADRSFAYLQQPLTNTFRGTLYCYHDTYKPDYLIKGKTDWVGQVPIHSYTIPTPQE